MNLKKLISGVAALIALSLTAALVQAQEVWHFEDDDIEFVLDPATLTPKTSGPLAIGDVFVSVFEVPIFTIDGVNAIAPDTELTGLVALELTAIIPGAGPGGVGTTYVFAPYTGGYNTILALGTDPDPVVPDDGTAVIAMWVNSTTGAGGDINLILNAATDPDGAGPLPVGATNCTSLADCIDQATLGTLIQVDGLAPIVDFWVAVQTFPGGGDIATVHAANAATTVAEANFSLHNIFNSPGTVISPLIGSASIQGGAGLSNGAIAHSDFDANKTVLQVPEPGSLLLLGIALAGLGLVRRRRKLPN